jgi:hypothetical protein
MQDRQVTERLLAFYSRKPDQTSQCIASCLSSLSAVHLDVVEYWYLWVIRDYVRRRARLAAAAAAEGKPYDANTAAPQCMTGQRLMHFLLDLYFFFDLATWSAKLSKPHKKVVEWTHWVIQSQGETRDPVAAVLVQRLRGLSNAVIEAQAFECWNSSFSAAAPPIHSSLRRALQFIDNVHFMFEFLKTQPDAWKQGFFTRPIDNLPDNATAMTDAMDWKSAV